MKKILITGGTGNPERQVGDLLFTAQRNLNKLFQAQAHS